VVSRIGRSDDRKWSPIVVDMLPRLFDLVPDVQVMLVGATSAVRHRLQRRGVLERVHLVEPTSDEAELAGYYAASDVLAMASSIGESFGLAIAEALSLGIPVVTNCTPWTDNAQVEVVDPGETGYIANHPAPFAEAVARLIHDPELRRRFGATGSARAVSDWDPARLTRQHEDLYLALASRGVPDQRWRPDVTAVTAFDAEYARRCRAEFRPLSRREQVNTRAARFEERALWAVTDWRGGSREQRAALARAAVHAGTRALRDRAGRG
jgi:hypothetical protein